MNADDRLLPIDEVCRRVGFCARKVYLLMARGEFPRSTHIGRSSRWSANEVAAWVTQQLEKREAVAS